MGPAVSINGLLVKPRNQPARIGTGKRPRTSAAANAIANASTIATEATKPASSASVTVLAAIPRPCSPTRSCPSFTGGPPCSFDPTPVELLRPDKAVGIWPLRYVALPIHGDSRLPVDGETTVKVGPDDSVGRQLRDSV